MIVFNSKEKSVHIYHNKFIDSNFTASENPNYDREVLALNALRRWIEMPVVGFCFVPEHVETRSLYHPTKPGIEQVRFKMYH